MRNFSLILGSLLTLFLFARIYETGAAQTEDAWGLIAAVNALRASYGLPPYEVDSALMAAAQAQSEWQKEIGTWSHSGPGGSRPHDRAVAFGYGGGAQVYVSENVAMGPNLTPQKAVYELWQDAVHLETMISSFYRHIGAGVAASENMVYYTILVGTIAGEEGSSPSVPGQGNVTPAAGVAPAATQLVVQPIQIATPMSDGSIIHVVQWGQFLITIADAYGISLKELLALNGLNENTVIYPGDKLIIRLPSTATSTLDAIETITATFEAENVLPKQTETRTPIATLATATPTSQVAIAIPSKTPVNGAQITLTPTVLQEPANISTSHPDYLLMAAIMLGAGGSILVGLGTALRRSS